MAPRSKASDLVCLRDKAYQAIKEAIVSNQLKPGEPLCEKKLADSLKMSRTPVRVALHKLEREGFVEVIIRKGAFVSRVSASDVEQLYQIREALEGMAANLAASRISAEDLARIEARFISLRTSQDQNELLEAGDELHDLILKTTRNERLAEMVDNLKDQIHRILYISSTVPGRVERAFGEHLEIIAALKKRDGQLAERAMREHLKNSRESALKVL